MIQKQCARCGALFSYEPPVGFPDKRKYCDVCGPIKKAEYEASKTQKVQPQAPGAQIAPTSVPTPIPANTYKPDYFQSKKEEDAGKVASMLISYVKDLIVAGKVESSEFRGNVNVMIELYNRTKKALINGGEVKESEEMPDY